MSLEDIQDNSEKEENLAQDSQNSSPSIPQKSSQQNSPESSSKGADSQDMQAQDLETKKNEDVKDKAETLSEAQNQIINNAENESETDQSADSDLYNEILEKLDIKKKEKKQDTQESKKDIVLQQTKQVEESIKQDFIKIQKFVNAGLINSAEGQNLKKQVLQKAFDMLVQTEKIKRTAKPSVTQNEVFDEFSKSNPDFFNSDGRKEVLNYLKSSDVSVGKDELNKISEIIRMVEKTAIDRYLKKVSHEKALIDSNETAKQRLTANAQKTNFNGNLSRTFTREQIGKMSGAEFAKYESAIMEQLKKGRIK